MLNYFHYHLWFRDRLSWVEWLIKESFDSSPWQSTAIFVLFVMLFSEKLWNQAVTWRVVCRFLRKKYSLSNARYPNLNVDVTSRYSLELECTPPAPAAQVLSLVLSLVLLGVSGTSKRWGMIQSLTPFYACPWRGLQEPHPFIFLSPFCFLGPWDWAIGYITCPAMKCCSRT